MPSLEVCTRLRHRFGQLAVGGCAHEERAAVLPVDVERRARLGARAGGDPRIPRRAAVLHARRPRARVDPGLEDHGLAEVEEVVLRASPGGAGRASGSRATVPTSATAQATDRLRRAAAARPGDGRAGEGAHADHQQVERAGHQLDDHQREAGDDPGEIRFHGAFDGRPILRLRSARVTASPGAWRRSPSC